MTDREKIEICLSTREQLKTKILEMQQEYTLLGELATELINKNKQNKRKRDEDR